MDAKFEKEDRGPTGSEESLFQNGWKTYQLKRTLTFNNLCLVFLLSCCWSIPVETMSFYRGEVFYETNTLRIPEIGFPIIGILFYGIYGIAIYVSYFLSRALFNIFFRNLVISAIGAMLLTAILGLVMEHIAIYSGFMTYTARMRQEHLEVSRIMPVDLSVYLYYMACINIPILILWIVVKTYLRRNKQ